MKIQPKPLFECDQCQRCSGTGEWACNLGRVCFKCSGRGWLMTKRGAAAQMFFNRLRQVPIETLQVGDKIGVVGRAGWWNIKSIEVIPWRGEQNEFRMDLERDEKSGGGKIMYSTYSGDLCIKSMPKSVVDSFRADALTYQATLTKHGKPSKSSTKKSSK